MRIHISTSPNTELVPYAYQQRLVGAFHKWLGTENPEHGDISLYSLSWLKGGKGQKKGLQYPNGAQWNISSPKPELLEKVISGIQADPAIAYGLEATEVRIETEPEFKSEGRFLVQSPVLVKQTMDEHKVHYYDFADPATDELLTATLRHKLEKADCANWDATVAFDRSYGKPKTKIVQYRCLSIKANVCPVYLKGDPEALAFAWNVGVGHSTGIGFGALW